MNAIAALTLTAPEGIGRTLVRSTLASKSRSTMSLKVQPAPRITTAPMPNSTISCQSGQRSGREGDAPPAREEQQPGTDRPVEPRQADIRPERLRRAAIDPIAGADIGAKLGHAVVLNTPKAVVLYGILDVIN